MWLLLSDGPARWCGPSCTPPHGVRCGQVGRFGTRITVAAARYRLPHAPALDKGLQVGGGSVVRDPELQFSPGDLDY